MKKSFSQAESSSAEEQSISAFEQESGIVFERAPVPPREVVPMQTAFTEIPRLESVTAEEYHRQYEEMKKSMPKNHAYAQRFSTGKPSRSTRADKSAVDEESEQTSVAAPVDDTEPAKSAKAARPAKRVWSSEPTASTEQEDEKPAVSDEWEEWSEPTASAEPSEPVWAGSATPSEPAPAEDNGELFEFYTGYEPSEEEAALLEEDSGRTAKKKGESFGARLKRSLSKFFAPDPPYDEE